MNLRWYHQTHHFIIAKTYQREGERKSNANIFKTVTFFRDASVFASPPQSDLVTGKNASPLTSIFALVCGQSGDFCVSRRVSGLVHYSLPHSRWCVYNPYSAETSESDVCRFQILTDKDGHCKNLNIYFGRRPILGIQMKWKDITRTFVMISN